MPKNNKQKQELRRAGAWGRLVSDIANGNGYGPQKAREILAIEKRHPYFRNEEIDHVFDCPGLRQAINKEAGQ
jgi:hypothetical protein